MPFLVGKPPPQGAPTEIASTANSPSHPREHHAILTSERRLRNFARGSRQTRPMNPPELDRQCERYARLKLWLSAAEYLVLLGTLVVLTATGLAAGWWQWLTDL